MALQVRDLGVSPEKGLLGGGLKKTVPAGTLAGQQASSLREASCPDLLHDLYQSQQSTVVHWVGFQNEAKGSVPPMSEVHGVEKQILRLGLGQKRYISEGGMDAQN